MKNLLIRHAIHWLLSLNDILSAGEMFSNGKLAFTNMVGTSSLYVYLFSNNAVINAFVYL